MSSFKTPSPQVDLRIVKLVGTLPSGVLTLFPSPSADDPQMDSLLSIEQVAEILGSSANHLRNIVGSILPFYKIGANARYRLSDVLKYIESCRRDERLPRQQKATMRSIERKENKRTARRAQQDAATA